MTARSLVGSVAGFVGAGLNNDEAASVVATGAHRTAIDAALRAAGVEVDRALATDRYVALDAAGCLDTFMVEETPDRGLFCGMAGTIIDRAGSGGRHVRMLPPFSDNRSKPESAKEARPAWQRLQ
jgi:hypothetical protein